MKAGWTPAALFLISCIVEIAGSENDTNPLRITVKDISIVNDEFLDSIYPKTVQALAVDDYLENHIVFSQGLAVYTMSMTTNEIDLIAGNRTQYYVEGIGTEAGFKQITALVTGPGGDKTSLLVCDLVLPCVRTIDRRTNETSVSAGNCSNKRASEIPGPITAIVNNSSNPNQYMIAVKEDDNLYIITYINDDVEVTMLLEPDYFKNTYTKDLYFDGHLAYSLTNFTLWELEISVTNVSRVTDRVDKTSWEDEPFSATNMFFVEKDFVVLIDFYNDGLLLMEGNDSYAIICSDWHAEAEYENCSLISPSTIIRHPSYKNILLVGGADLYAITLTVDDIDEAGNGIVEDSSESENATLGVDAENDNAADLEGKIINNKNVLIYSLIGGGVFIALVAVIAVVALRKRGSNEDEPKMQSVMTNSAKSLEGKENQIKGKREASKTLKVVNGKGSQMTRIGGTSKAEGKVKGQASLSSAIIEPAKEAIAEQNKVVKAKKPKRKPKNK